MDIYLMRHGQTDLNVQKRLQGSSDIPLNDRGRFQASETRKLFEEKGIKVTKIIASPLERAIETGHLATGIGMDEIGTEQNLIEMSFGIYEQQNMETVDPEFLGRCFDHPETYEPPANGECYDEVVARAGAVVEMLRKKISHKEFTEEDVILLVSHGALSHGMFEYIKKTPRAAYWDVDFNNCAIAKLTIGVDRSEDDYTFISNGFEKNW
ncbi:histidine phosphatase family protein [Pseudobutyrivibrio ruminis]|uniref:Histidine phosphatase family protein n=1 Tax=Pseudobutyrivibrio ruminis TaxID=46206 RepID=A0A2G3DY65_9FIRM|nr:histidine phosphatase family protein [Pseudobutyrivibrio ruminis]PHU35956.1 hypothetical protein CSX01_01610 [Pseudobutyrivibrio ruminis]